MAGRLRQISGGPRGPLERSGGPKKNRAGPAGQQNPVVAFAPEGPRTGANSK
jgi:hypothetical protein